MILKVAIKCYCEKNKGGIIYEKNACPVDAISYGVRK